MNKTPEGRPSSADVENKNLSVIGKLGQAAAKAAGAVRDIVRTAKNRNGFAERLGINTENKNGLAAGVDVDSAAAEGVLSSDSSTESGEKDSREGSSNGLTPKQIEVLRRDARVVVISNPEEQISDNTEDASGSSAEKNIPVSEPPEPTLADLDRIKWNDYMRDAAAKRSVLVHPTTEEDLRELESFGVDIYSRYSPEEVSRVKGENVIDKEMFRTTIPNVDDNPEGLTLYEQAMRDKYLGDEHDDAEKTEDDEAAASLKVARERFAKASIAVETHFSKKYFGGKKRQAELEAATEQLKQSELEYMRLKFADKIEAAKQDPKKQAELAAEMGQAAFASMRETSRTTTDKYDNMLDDRGKFKKAAAKVGKWFNKGGKIAQWLKLGGTGFVGGAIVGSVAAWPITTAVGIVTELGVAGATKQAVLEEHRGEDRIAADDRLETIDPSFEKTVANMKIDDVMEHAVNVSVDNLKDVSTERQDALRKKVRSSLGKYGVGFALGGFAGKYIGDWANSAHATGGEGNADTTPQSGGEQTPQSGGASSADNPAAKAIVDNINPDTSNFNSYDYPWDWAAEKFGDANAIDQLHNLADKAMANGHTVEWFNNPDGSVWMKVDGSSATADVLKVLNKYA
ncbi:hypothetical protein [Candidatus Minimicrobia sp. QA0096]|uniref:hypothetical protein n=1 Tax=Candidatus Minimicrobia sp. QA0096 TaxID=3118470 RepID=UPI0030D3C370